MDDIRRKRVAETIRAEVSALLLRGDIKDPRVDSFLSITRAEISKDGAHSKLYVSTFKNAEALQSGIDGLNNAAGFIQSQIAKRLYTRLTPRLVFIADPGIKMGFELDEKIKGLFS